MNITYHERIILVIAFILISMGLLGNYSLSIRADSLLGDRFIWHYGRKIGIGILFYLVIRRLRFESLEKYAGYAFFAASISMLLCLLTRMDLLFNDHRKWLNFGITDINPSPFLVVAAIFHLSKLLTRRAETKRVSIRFQMLAATVIVSALLLLILSDSVGDAVILGLTAIAIAWMNKKIRFSLFIMSALFLSFWLSVCRQYRSSAFSDPYSDTLDRVYPLVLSLTAIQNGLPWGLGLGKGITPIPGETAIFLLPHMVEELGVAAILPILAVMILLGKLLAVFSKEKNNYTRTTTSAIIAFLLLQISINLLEVTALIPTIDVVLPIVANSGSSAIVSFIYWGLLACRSTSRHYH